MGSQRQADSEIDRGGRQTACETSRQRDSVSGAQTEQPKTNILKTIFWLNRCTNQVKKKNPIAMWEELEHLFARCPTMNPQKFSQHIQKLGIELSQEALRALFDKYDRDKSGQIDVYEVR